MDVMSDYWSVWEPGSAILIWEACRIKVFKAEDAYLKDQTTASSVDMLMIHHPVGA